MHDTVGYPPFDILKPVDTDLWIVDAKPIHPAGLPLPLRMTVVRLADGGLLLHSPTQHTPQLQHALEEIGPVRHLVAPSIAHWMFLLYWQRACPAAVTWGAPGLRGRKQLKAARVKVDADLDDTPPPPWRGEVDHVLVRSGPYSEVAMFHRASRTLLLTDLALNLEGSRMPPLPRAAASLAGILAPTSHAPLQVRLMLALNGAAVAEAARRLVSLEPARVIMTHGTPFEDGAADRLRAALAPLLRGREAQRALYGAAAGFAALLIAAGVAVARRRGR